jgi:hypothetical protein
MSAERKERKKKSTVPSEFKDKSTTGRKREHRRSTNKIYHFLHHSRHLWDALMTSFFISVLVTPRSSSWAHPGTRLGLPASSLSGEEGKASVDFFLLPTLKRELVPRPGQEGRGSP